MLSILIPIYNYPCYSLVAELVNQCLPEKTEFEVICCDDHSTAYREENKKIKDLPCTSVIELKENIGRSRIRNLLAAQSKYPNLLFLDCDSSIPDNQFIKRYIQTCRNYNIISGGRIYHQKPPTDKRFYLHWKYGSQREPQPTSLRKGIFNSNNFMVKREIMLKFPFNEKIVRYGHEDTLFHIELENNGISPEFIINPVIHEGLETSSVFLEKTRQGIHNIFFILQNGILNPKDYYKIGLLHSYIKIKKYNLDVIMAYIYPAIKKICTAQLNSKYPLLFFMDIYKISYLSYLAKNNKP